MKVATTILVLACLFLGACGDDGPQVVLYCGVDQDQSQHFADLFQQETGIQVAYHGESEAMRSVGLPQRLMMERKRPRADVFWANEIMHMVHLCRSGVMAPLPKGVAEQFPEGWRDPKGQYVAFGARGRILLVNTELLPDEKDHPHKVADLIDPKYAAMGLVTSMAEPLTGTTYTHAVALLTKDEAATKEFFAKIAAARESGAMKLVLSNGQVMRLVKDASNKVAFGLTDTDDAWSAMQENPKLKVIDPDSGEGEAGTVLIPNTVAIVKDGPNSAQAPKLLRWLASASTEAALAKSATAQIPLREGVAHPDEARLKWVPGKDFVAAKIDWEAVAGNIDRWRDYLANLFKPAR